MYYGAPKCFFHPDCTVGIGITPILRLCARGLYRRSGISPCPETLDASSIAYLYLLVKWVKMWYDIFIQTVLFGDLGWHRWAPCL